MRIFVCLLAVLAVANTWAAELSSVLTADVLKKSSFELPQGVYTTGNFTIPQHFTLKFAPGAVISVNKNACLTINGAIESSLQKIFVPWFSLFLLVSPIAAAPQDLLSLS